MSEQILDLVKPQEYFRTKVNAAASELNVKLDEQVEFYIVNLLCQFIAPFKNEDDEASDIFNTPLAFILQKALEAEPETQTKIYRKLGDTSLYFAGYFQDYFNRKTYDISYYISMGRNAYRTASQLLRERHGEDPFSEVYKDLSRDFQQLVDVVAQISDDEGDHQPLNILATYDRWNQTKSERLRRLLEKEGIIPIPTKTSQAQ